ncbi:MAG: VWA domain-containing protein [Candidatus Promineofilum sp.]|nr:VWA domain-containing protein [Promineifilum sp.]
MSFTTPVALLLLLLLPLMAWLVWPRRPGARLLSGRLGLILRLLIVALVVLSLAGAQLVRAVDDLAVVFLVDVSDSMGDDNIAAAEQFVRAAVAQMSPDDRAAIILFGSNALVEQPLRSLDAPASLPPFASQPARIATDLAEAIRLGLALLPPDAARRLVILSDGAATTGDATQAARLAAASGVSIDTLHMPRPPAEGEIILRDVVAPVRVGQGETFRLEVSAESTAATDAVLRVMGDGAVIYEQTVRLQPGTNNLAVRLQAGAPAFARYRVQLSPVGAADAYPQNNELAAFTEVVGQPRALVVAAKTDGEGAAVDEAAQLVETLTASGLSIDRATPLTLSSGLADLADYAAIVLANVNARDLSPRKMATLQAYVRDLGGGLVAVGGPDSFGVGGYFDTPLEEALPVNMQIDDPERFPAVSMVLVIDRSGSMASTEGGVTKIQLAAEGAIRALELLNDFDDMTLIPVDEAPDEIIGPITAANRDEAIARMRGLGAGGGGIFVRTGLEAAARALAASDNEVRHIIVLADGADAEQQEGVAELIEELTADGITVSMISIGAGPDTPWLQAMAELGGGRFHLTDQAANLPQIFTQETLAIQRNYVIEERFFPTQAATHPILTGITATPPLYGYVGTSAKATAQTPLVTHLGDPLLATWQYGLGRSVAWTSDATGRWGRDWVRWAGFGAFWNQAVRWSFGARGAEGLSASVRLDGETARLVVDAQTDGRFLNDLALTANVVDPAGEARPVELRPVAPGRYEGTFTPTAEGAYFIGVGTADGALQTTAGWVLGYSPEYAALDDDPALLAALAEATGGRTLDIGDAAGTAAVFDHNLPAAAAVQPIWPWLTLVAALLLPLDVAARRLTLTRRDWARAWGKIRTYEPGNRHEAMEPERGEGLAQLLRAKEKKAEALGGRHYPSGIRPGDEPSASGISPAGDNPAEPPSAADSSPAAPGLEEESLAARLRKRRNL